MIPANTKGTESTISSAEGAPNFRMLRKRALQNGEELRRIKYAKTRGGMPMSSSLNLVVIGTGAPGSPASILINGDHANYLVNCGESVQRIVVEHNLRLSKVEQVFCTSKSWRNVGGLLGMCLTLEQAGVPNITFHGDENCLRMVRLHGGFADDRFNDSQLRYHDHRKTGRFEDANFVIRTHELDPSLDLDQDNTGIDCSTCMFVFQPKATPPNVDAQRCAELGIGKSDGRLIKELKDNFDDLSFSVTLGNGRVVCPADICKPQSHCGPVIVFECPSLNFLRRLEIATNKATSLIVTEDGDSASEGISTFPKTQPGDWNGHVFSGLCDAKEPALVVHFTHFTVASCTEYQSFINSFPPSTRHLVLDGSCTAPACVGVYRNQAVMHLAHPQIFPLLPGLTVGETCARNNISRHTAKATSLMNEQMNESTSVCPYEASSTDTEDTTQKGEVAYARPGLRFQIRPRPAFNESCCLRIVHDDYVREVFDKSADLRVVLDTLELRRAQLAPFEAATQEVHPRFIFLGTGSSVPSKTRNVSAFLVEIDANNCLLFDCGEGTYAQLVRHYGNEADNMLNRLRAVFVSHMHADHHGGLFTVLTEWHRVTQNIGKNDASVDSLTRRLVLFAPQRVASWLKVYDEIILDNRGSLLDYVELVAAQDLCPPEWRPKASAASVTPAQERLSHVQLQLILAACGMRSLVAVPVLHACQPFGFVTTLASGIKLVYSGDTMPCERLIEAGRNCDVVVHESTMEDDLINEARLKKHSTIGQAVEVAKQMNARHCILTHFSQRYSKIPPVYSNAQLFNAAETTENAPALQIGVAFDHMRVSLSDIGFFRYLLPFFRSAFPDCFETMVTNLEKRTNKKSRALEAGTQMSSNAAGADVQI